MPAIWACSTAHVQPRLSNVAVPWPDANPCKFMVSPVNEGES